jgi:serine/threonine-protein kinase
MAHDREERFASAAEMREALEAWLEAQPARAGQRELAAFVAAAFTEDREKLRAKIDEQLKRLRSGERGSMALLQLDVGGEGTPSRESEVMVQTSAATAQLTPIAAKPAGRSWVRALAVASAAVIAGAVVLAQRSLSSPGGGDPGAASASASAAGSVDVVLRYSPGDAEVTLDGARVEGNPFRGRFPRDAGVHQVEVRAAGFRAERRVLSLERDHELTIDLAREEVSAAASAATAAPPEPAAAPPEPGITGGAAPGSRKPPAQKPQHAIDEKNPYGK